jgi:hypothetical protein
MGFVRALRFWASWLDDRFRIPGTNIRFGSIQSCRSFQALAIWRRRYSPWCCSAHAIGWGVPRIVLARMVFNALIDAAIGAIPIAGNIGDIFWRANTANLQLLERHARPGVPPRPGDYAFVWIITALLGLLLLVPIAFGIWIALLLWHWLTA